MGPGHQLPASWVLSVSTGLEFNLNKWEHMKSWECHSIVHIVVFKPSVLAQQRLGYGAGTEQQIPKLARRLQKRELENSH